MLSKIKRLIPPDFFLRLWYHQLTGWLAALRYGFPGKKMTIIGVTGTNGKSTVTQLLTDILVSTNRKVGMASTVNFRIGDKTWQNETHKTTLGRFQLQSLLRKMYKQGVEIVVLEVSSHALSQGRLNGITFDTAVFTNLSREHLDYHRTMDRYFNEKKKLFSRVSNRKKGSVPRTIVTNMDDEYGKRLIDIPVDQMFGITLDKSAESTMKYDVLSARSVNETAEGITFSLQYHGQAMEIHSHVHGVFNVYNLLTVAATAIAHGVSLDVIKYNLNSFDGVPGRLEKVGKTSRGATVFIDYAVTPDSFKVLFDAVRTVTAGRIIAVFGACGDRDKGKRPMLGEVAGNMCDLVIVTNEEPYHEDPTSIIDMIWEGVRKTTHKENITAFRIPEREDAITFAIERAEEGDTIVVSGMGDQTSMMIGDRMVPWSDREIITKYLQK